MEINKLKKQNTVAPCPFCEHLIGINSIECKWCKNYVYELDLEEQNEM